jgi:hypothetical protein
MVFAEGDELKMTRYQVRTFSFLAFVLVTDVLSAGLARTSTLLYLGQTTAVTARFSVIFLLF